MKEILERGIHILNDRPTLRRYRCNRDELVFLEESVFQDGWVPLHRKCPKCSQPAERLPPTLVAVP